MGQEEVPGHVQAGGDGQAEGKDGGPEENEAEAGKINLRKILDGTHVSTSALIKVGQI